MRGRQPAERSPADSGRAPDHTVTVAELIEQQPDSVRSGLSDVDDHRELTERHGESADTSRRSLPRPHVLAAALVVLLLCGAAVAGSAILARSSADAPRPARSALISGAEALRPDLLARARWPFADNGGGARPPDLPGPPPFTGRLPTPPPASDPLSGLVEANPWVGTTESTLELVHEFYRLLDSAPERAVRLVSPEVLGAQRAEVVRSWQAIASVRTARSHVRQDGSVIAEVVAERADGTRLVLRHALTVQEGTHPEIVEVRLVSARLPPPG